MLSRELEGGCHISAGRGSIGGLGTAWCVRAGFKRNVVAGLFLRGGQPENLRSMRGAAAWFVRSGCCP